MSTSTDARPAGETAESSTLAAILIELDGAILDLRPALCETATALLRKAGVALTPALFARHGLFATAPVMARNLIEQLDVSGLTEDDLSAALAARIEAYLQKEASVPAPVEKLLKAAGQRGLPVALVTALPEELVRTAADRLGLTASGVRLFAFKDEEKGGFPRADIWLKVAKGLSKSARFCVAFTSSQISAKSALSAGMRCVVVPDRFTSHQDFGGADLVLDSWTELSAGEILDAVVPAVR
jgi:beta-phosphoglucomutase-like phosphatase (HAD superfamily)